MYYQIFIIIHLVCHQSNSITLSGGKAVVELDGGTCAKGI